jgi:hypothetical protein
MIAAVLMFAAQLAVGEDSQQIARFGPLPKDVAAFIDRRTACNHFAGEFNGDRSERDRDVTRTMNQLRCGALERDEARLQRRYTKVPQVLRALTDTRDWQ